MAGFCAMPTLPYSRQDIDDADVAAVVESLRADFITQGPAVPAFEAAVAAYVGVPHAIALSNGTAALHLACLALDIGPGDLVWTSPISFVASANCARYCGAEVDFVDVDPGSVNLSPQALRDKLALAKRAGRLPKALIPVHFGGAPCNMAEIAELARAHGVAVIEDASHALGADYAGARVGNGIHSDFTVLSFHPVKMITTAEGGMLTTRSAKLRERLELLRSHGVTRRADLLEDKDAGGWYYEQHELGYNYRLTDIQAALGASQMRRLPRFLEARRRLAARYRERLAGLPLACQSETAAGESSYHLFVVQIDLKAAQRTRREVYDALHREGIRVNVHYIPIHLQPYYRRLGFKAGAFPAAERYYERALSLPLFPALTASDQDRVVGALGRALGRA
jgi:UDP-4-amino-4,6-dideoxy-N-acetyl-beta-L-altrosamine transaminase